MRWSTLILAAGLVAVGLPSIAQASPCTTFNIEDGTPLTPSLREVGEVTVCDDNRDGRIDEVTLRTYGSTPTRTTLEASHDNAPRTNGQDEAVRAEAQVSTGIVFAPAAKTELHVVDEGDDERLDKVETSSRARVDTTPEQDTWYRLQLFDPDGDGVPNGWGLKVCSNFVGGCETPGPHQVPDVDPSVPSPIIQDPIFGWYLP